MKCLISAYARKVHHSKWITIITAPIISSPSLERFEAGARDASRESLTPPSLNPAYKIEINHDNEEDSGDFAHTHIK